jgi:hypothetical protein
LEFYEITFSLSISLEFGSIETVISQEIHSKMIVTELSDLDRHGCSSRDIADLIILMLPVLL